MSTWQWANPLWQRKAETMSIFAAHTYLAQNNEQYIEYITKALSEDNELRKQERRDFASTHTWENNAKEIYKAINLF